MNAKAEDTKRRARIWAAYVKQGETWVPKDASPIQIVNMDAGWRANAARWLLRRAGTVEFYYSYAELHYLTGSDMVEVLDAQGDPVPGKYVYAPMPDDVQYYLNREFDQRAADPEGWLKTTPLYQALVKDLPDTPERAS